MSRKRITEVFPFLLPLRIWQRNFFWTMKKKLDKNKYAKEIGKELLPYNITQSKTFMINKDSGQDIIYQKNKVDNLKIASKTIDQLLIYPGEVFSLCWSLRKSKKYGKYKDGLILMNGSLTTQKGGGLCHLSDLLYYLFLMSPLTIVERHGHKVKSLPNPDKNALEGIDATINSGWLDLQVRNDTKNIYQIHLSFDEDYMYGKILSNEESNIDYTIINENFKYIKRKGKVYESCSVIKVCTNKKTNKTTSKKKLYDEVVEITYKLDPKIEIEEEINET